MIAANGLRQVRSHDGSLGIELPGGVVVGANEAALKGARRGRDLLWRAVLSGTARVVDATAGLGGDAFHIAGKGAEVVMIERSAPLIALLEDALARAAAGSLGERARLAAGRVLLVAADARQALLNEELTGVPDVVYLDPMFASTLKRSAPGKGLALLRAALGSVSQAEEAELLAVATAVARRRVVVKRQVAAPPLAGVRPSGTLAGSTTRYDLYPPRRE